MHGSISYTMKMKFTHSTINYKRINPQLTAALNQLLSKTKDHSPFMLTVLDTFLIINFHKCKNLIGYLCSTIYLSGKC